MTSPTTASGDNTGDHDVNEKNMTHDEYQSLKRSELAHATAKKVARYFDGPTNLVASIAFTEKEIAAAFALLLGEEDAKP